MGLLETFGGGDAFFGGGGWHADVQDDHVGWVLVDAVQEFGGYLAANASWIPNYGERRRAESGTNRGRQSYEKRLACRSVPAVGVDGRGGCGDGVERRLGIDPQAAQAGVAAFGALR